MQNIRKLMIFLLFAIFHASYSFGYLYNTSVVSMFRDEAPYLKEWIEYYKLIGVEHFYLYNIGSLDNYIDILTPYIKKGEVELFHRPATNNHAEFNVIHDNVYRDAIQRSKKKTKWLLVIDSDEFVVPIVDNNINDFLAKHENNSIGGIYLWWIWFGTSYVKQIPEGSLMIELLHLNKGPVPCGKSIVRPDRVKNVCNPHACTYKKRYSCKTIEVEEAQINHYWSRDEYYAYHYKWPRRQAWGMPFKEFENWLNDGNRENPQYFEPIVKFIEPLRKRMFTKQAGN